LSRQAGSKKEKRPASDGGRYKIKKHGSSQPRNDLGGGARGAKARDNPVAANAKNVRVFARSGIETEIGVRTKILAFTAAR
jgi:hypothetical protein